MQQLQQWKKNRSNKLKIEPVKSAVKNPTESKNGSCKNPQENEQFAPKVKNKGKLHTNPLAFKYAQLTRQFRLIQDSNKRCLEVYPDDFHHKVKFRDEMADLVNKLAGGGNLLNTLAKTGNLSQENANKLKDFNRANRYLIHKFSEVVEQIGVLNAERTEQQKGSK